MVSSSRLKKLQEKIKILTEFGISTQQKKTLRKTLRYITPVIPEIEGRSLHKLQTLACQPIEYEPSDYL